MLDIVKWFFFVYWGGYLFFPLFSSLQFSRSVLSDSLRPHELQHPRLPCPSPTPWAYSNSCTSWQWFHPTISSCHPLLLLPSIFHSIRVFSSESILCIRWPKYWSFSISISPSNEYSGLISFRIDWLDLLAVWGSLKSLLQHHSSKASVLWHSAFFIVPSVRFIPFLSLVVSIFDWNVPLVSLIFLRRSLVFPILLFSSISLHWPLRKAFLSLLAILWKSAFKWAYLSFFSFAFCFSSFHSYL